MRHYRYPLAVDKDAENLCLGGQFVEAGELRRAGVDQVTVFRQIGMRLFARGRIGLGALALLGHQATEAFFIDTQAGLGGHLERQFQREAVSVVQRERVGTRKDGGARGLGRTGRLVEQPRARCQGAVERGLLGDRDAVDPVEVGDEFGVRRAHRVAHRRHQVADDRVVDAEQLGRADDAAQQPPQYVAAAVIARAHAVADQDRGGAAVVGDDPVAHVVLVVACVISARGDRGYGIYDRAQQVGLVDVVHTLQQARHPLDTHAGVDVLARQRPEDLEVLLGRCPRPARSA